MQKTFWKTRAEKCTGKKGRVQEKPSIFSLRPTHFSFRIFIVGNLAVQLATAVILFLPGAHADECCIDLIFIHINHLPFGDKAQSWWYCYGAQWFRPKAHFARAAPTGKKRQSERRIACTSSSPQHNINVNFKQFIERMQRRTSAEHWLRTNGVRGERGERAVKAPAMITAQPNEKPFHLIFIRCWRTTNAISSQIGNRLQFRWKFYGQ